MSSATGIALNLVNADGSFRPDRVSSTGAPSGIVWNNTTVATGLLEVRGNATGSQNSTGGTITGSTGPSVRLHNTRNVVLWSLSITNPANLAGTHGILATEMTGTNDFRGIVVSGVADNQSSSMDISNTSQSLAGLTIRGSKITSSNSTRTALLVQNKGNQSMVVGVNTTELSALFPVAAQFASGQNAGTSGSLTVTFTDNQLLNAPASGANSVNFVGINSSTLNVTATGNTATNVGKPVASVGVFSVSAQDTASVNAKINGNAISSINGYQAVNLAAENNATTLKVQVDNNDINGLQSSGITLNVNTNAQNTNVSITNNRIGNVTPVGTNSGAMESSFSRPLLAAPSPRRPTSWSAATPWSTTTGGWVRRSRCCSAARRSLDHPEPHRYQQLLRQPERIAHSAYLEAAESVGAVCLDMTGNNSNGQPIDVVKNGQPFTIRNRDQWSPTTRSHRSSSARIWLPRYAIGCLPTTDASAHLEASEEDNGHTVHRRSEDVHLQLRAQRVGRVQRPVAAHKPEPGSFLAPRHDVWRQRADNFVFPNLQGRAPVHVGQGLIQGQAGGEVSHILTAAEMPPTATPSPPPPRSRLTPTPSLPPASSPLLPSTSTPRSWPATRWR